ncbi:MAG: lipid-A-disaccharide synthase [Acidobacteriota bacterium]
MKWQAAGPAAADPAVAVPSTDRRDNALSILVITGEASGDLHGATLVRSLRQMAPQIECFGVGGDRMAGAGCELLYHMRHLAVVGITEVLRHLRDVRQALATLTAAAAERRVDAVVLVDYPDFNLTLARRLRRALPGVPIIYYISPQIWAWRAGRVSKIARLVDSMLVILPFEEEIYASAGVPVTFVGHPLLDVVQFDSSRPQYAAKHGVAEAASWVGLLPGSRRAEIERLFPAMLSAARLLSGDSDLAFLVPVSCSVEKEVYARCLAQLPVDERERVHLVAGDHYATLQHSAVAAVCSGTATLEAALADTPPVVVYRTSWLTYNLAKSLVHVRDIALVNLIAGRRAVPELVQGAVTGPRLAHELRMLLEDDARRRDVHTALAEVRQRLGRPGASRRAAQAVLSLASGSHWRAPSAAGVATPVA